jgi:chromosome segregation ATPase
MARAGAGREGPAVSNWNTLIIAVVAIVPTSLAAFLSWRSSVRANRATELATVANARKVDAEVFEKTQGLYDRAVQAAQREIDRLQTQQEKVVTQLESVVTQFEAVREQLFEERGTSALLRGQVSLLQMQVGSMSEMIATLRHQIDTLSGKAAPPAAG